MSTKSVDKNSGTDTRTQLILTGIRLFAEFGTKGKSLREVIRASGNKNEASIRYYFKNREGFIAAIVEYISDRLEPLQKQAWDKLIQLEGERALEPIDVLRAEFLPLLLLYFSGDDGVDAMRVVARLVREEHELGQDMLIGVMGKQLFLCENKLAELLPDKPPRALRFQHFLAINSMVNGLSDKELIFRLQDPENPEERMAMGDVTMFAGFMRYVTAGVTAEWNLDFMDDIRDWISELPPEAMAKITY